MPGGLISIMFIMVVLAYGLLKLKYMVYVEEWELTQQRVPAESYDI